MHALTFNAGGKQRGAELEAHLALGTVAGPPATWSLLAGSGAGVTQASSLHEGGDLRCNAWSCWEVDPVDQFCNGWGLPGVGYLGRLRRRALALCLTVACRALMRPALSVRDAMHTAHACVLQLRTWLAGCACATAPAGLAVSTTRDKTPQLTELRLCRLKLTAAQAAELPTPRIVPEGDQALEWDEDEWEQGWQARVRQPAPLPIFHVPWPPGAG